MPEILEINKIQVLEGFQEITFQSCFLDSLKQQKSSVEEERQIFVLRFDTLVPEGHHRKVAEYVEERLDKDPEELVEEMRAAGFLKQSLTQCVHKMGGSMADIIAETDDPALTSRWDTMLHGFNARVLSLGPDQNYVSYFRTEYTPTFKGTPYHQENIRILQSLIWFCKNEPAFIAVHASEKNQDAAVIQQEGMVEQLRQLGYLQCELD